MILALDIGGTNIRSATVKGKNIKLYQKNKTPPKRRQILERITEIIQSYEKPKAICISTAGFERNGVIQNSLNNDLDGAHLSETIKQKFHVPVYLENDANCAALAELNYGAGKKLRNFVMLTLGSGIGCGVIINKQLYRSNGSAGEVGSMIINKKDLFEHLASGNASVKIAKQKGMKVSSRELEELANKGNKKALSVYKEVGENLGIGISNLAYLFDPQKILIGGGFSRVKHIYKPTENTYKKFFHLTPRPPIIKAKFGDDAGLIGAACLINSNKLS